jgi:hypothetical protein
MSNAARTTVKRAYTTSEQPDSPKSQFNFRLSARDLERLDKLAAELELSRAGVIRHLIKQASST